eukprot:scaffold28641_cov31-Tisochrysis_lutea.AAC.2
MHGIRARAMGRSPLKAQSRQHGRSVWQRGQHRLDKSFPDAPMQWTPRPCVQRRRGKATSCAQRVPRCCAQRETPPTCELCTAPSCSRSSSRREQTSDTVSSCASPSARPPSVKTCGTRGRSKAQSSSPAREGAHAASALSAPRDTAADSASCNAAESRSRNSV